MNIETECFKKVVIVIYKEELQMEKKLNVLLSNLEVEYHKLKNIYYYYIRNIDKYKNRMFPKVVYS